MTVKAERPDAGRGLGGEIDAERLRALLEARGLRLRPEDEAATLSTARFLQKAAEIVDRASS
jgi:hypothetical protein